MQDIIAKIVEALKGIITALVDNGILSEEMAANIENFFAGIPMPL